MKIAIQAADLDNKRIDGTRVYLLNVLKYLGKISPEDDFLIYHRKDFNLELVPPEFPNYRIKKVSSPFLWTQTRFAWEVWRDSVDVLWMPMHNIPILGRRKGMKTVVTIHDLAFKNFPKTFPKKDLRELNMLTDLAVRKSDKIIAVSNSTKNDILKFYPEIDPGKIKVIYHGFDRTLFEKKYSEQEIKKVLMRYGLQDSRYALYVGAIQPRKNLKVLIKAFEIIKSEVYKDESQKHNNNLKLVLAGGRAWSWEDTLRAVEESPERENIVLTDRISFDEISILYRRASVFVFPSLYEGFGIPVLEAFASSVPVITSRNSSLEEVGGEAVEYFDGKNPDELSLKINKVLGDENLQREMVIRGKEQLKKFSWEKCARETLDFLKS